MTCVFLGSRRARSGGRNLAYMAYRSLNWARLGNPWNKRIGNSIKFSIIDSYFNLPIDTTSSTGYSLDIVFFPRILESLPPLPRQHSAAICCTKNYQPIGVTGHSHYIENFEGLLQRCRRGMGYSELWKKPTIFLNTLYLMRKCVKACRVMLTHYFVMQWCRRRTY